MTTPARLTVFTSTVPERLTKLWMLDKEGQPTKISGGEMVRGSARIATVESVDAFAALLQSLTHAEALTYGIPAADGPVMTRKAWIEAGKPSHVICRTKERMQWPDGPGVFYLDHDIPKNGKAPLTRTELIAALETVCPALAECGLVHWQSSSSMIFNDGTGEMVRGEGGQRIYFIVENAVDIPAAGERLQTLLWAHGYGHVEISAAGSLLPRTIFDASVWQVNRFDFAAGAACMAPLVQRRGAPFVRPGRAVRLLADIPAPTETEEGQARLALDNAKAAASPKAAGVKEAHIAVMAKRIAGEGAQPDEIRRATEIALRAVDGGSLAGDFKITVIVDGEAKEFPVLHVIDNAAEFHGADTLDPVEPDYDRGRPVGRLYLIGSTPRLYSFAHGGRTFRLLRNPAMIEVAVGRESYVDERVMDAMRLSHSFYEQSGRLIQMDGDEMQTVTEHSLLYWMRANCAFYTRRLKQGVVVDTPVAASPQTARVILSIGSQRRIPVLRAIVTAQTLTLDGAIICENGFNAESGLLLRIDEDNILRLPDTPTIEDAQAAVERIMHPFRHFPFVTVCDRSIMLASILSATVRTAMDTCPGFGFDAPIQGSGKTLLAKSVHAIATGTRGNVKPHVGGHDDEEIRKRILSILMAGDRCVVWDNIVGLFNSEAMAALLTASEYSDRFLGKTQTVTAPNTALWLFTGNNLQMSGDMPRRVFRCRIDPRTEEPYAREFDFDPESFCIQRRHEIVRDALTIIKAWMAAGRPMAPGRTASFEQWDLLVRQPIAWLAAYDEHLADPMEAMREGQAADPENASWGDFLEALHRRFHGDEFIVRDVLAVYDKVEAERRGREEFKTFSTDEATIHETILDALTSRRDITAKRIGRFFANRLDKISRGLRLVRLAKERDCVKWAVQGEKRTTGTLFEDSKAQNATNMGATAYEEF